MSNPASVIATTSATTVSSSSTGVTHYQQNGTGGGGHERLTTSAEEVPFLMVRPSDELEGSLLPVARQVHDDDHADDNHVMAAVPTQVFQYDEATLAAEQQQQQQTQLRHQQPPHSGEQVAHHITTSSSAATNDYHYLHQKPSEAIAPDDRFTIKQAEHLGVIRSEEEKEAIRNANRRVYAHNYHEELAIQIANEIAKRRDREGLQVRQQPQRQPQPEQADGPSLSTNAINNKDQYNQGGHGHRNGHERVGGGYHVRDYNVDEKYEPKEYDVKEYKSVYD